MSPITEHALAAWPLLTTELLIFGTAAFCTLVAPADSCERRVLRRAFAPLWRVLSLAALVLSPLAMLADTAAMAGVALGKAFPLLPEMMRGTHIGRVWGWRLGFAIILTAAAWLPAQRRAGVVSISAAAAALLLLGSLSSHAIDHGSPAIALYFFHELAAGFWIGALAGLWTGCTRAGLGDRWVEQAAPRVSRTAGYSVAILVLTGIYNAYNALGLMPDHLLYSAYGRTLLVKLALFAIVVSVGGYNRYQLVPEIDKASSRDLLLRNVAVESLLLIAVVGAAALVANTPPAHHH